MLGGGNFLWADPAVYATYTVSLNDGVTQTPSGSFFTVTTGGGFNTKYAGKYNGTDYTKGLKVNSSSSITFTTTVTSDITIVQSTSSNSTSKFKLGGQSVAHNASDKITIGGTDVNYSMTENATDKYLEFVFTDVPATTNLAITNDGETGIFFVKVELTQNPSAITKLSTPIITANATTGSVTIGTVANAEKVTYTTDGTTPTASSATYSEPFVVADGTVVKAIAIGNGTSYSNSDVATETVYLTGFKVAAPVVSQFNGTAVLNCATPNATIEYSTDGGTSWNTYSRAFTLTTTTDIKVRASRANCTTSDVTEETITAVPANTKTKTIVMGYGAFEGSGKVLTGLSSDVAKGFTLTMITDQNKSWSGRNSITISEIEETRTTFCGSNGVQCKLDMPDGIIATQLRLYSYVNASTSTTNCAWKEVNGENLNSTLNTVPMGAFSDVEGYQTNPDVRIFPLDNVEGSLTFTNGGIQTCFVIVLDVIETEAISTLSGRNYASYVTTNKLDFASAEGITAFIATGLNDGGTAVELTPVDVVPASTPIIVKTETKGATVNVPVTTADASDISGNKLVAGDGTTAWNGTDGYTYYYLAGDKFHLANDGTLQTGKAYLKIEEAVAARDLTFVFGDATSIKAIDNAQLTIDNYYNLSGQRVAQPKKGLYIQSGKKVIIK